jgi:hypothetical protein
MDIKEHKMDHTDYTLEELTTNLSNNVYMAATVQFERAENAGLIHGNGHHMAQELAQKAADMMKAAVSK